MIGDAVWDETHLLEWVSQQIKEANCKSIDYLPQINEADAYSLLTIPIFDPFWETRSQAYCGIMHPGGAPRPSEYLGKPPLVYFNLKVDLTRLAAVLQHYDNTVDAYFGPQNQVMSELLKGSRVKIHDKPFDLAKELPGRRFALHAGTLGMSAAAMYGAVPSFSLLLHDEGYCNARATMISGTGHAESLTKVDVKSFSARLCDDSVHLKMRDFAAALSDRYSKYRDQNPIDAAIDAIKKLIC